MIERMDNVGIVVDELRAAIACFVEPGLESDGELVRLALTRFHTPPASTAEPNAPVGLVGFALACAGISLTAPIVFGIAGRRPDAGSAVATVTTIGYLGLLVGPPLVGGIAQATSLRVSFFALAVVAAAVAAATSRLRFD